MTVDLLATDAVSGVNETLYSLDGTDPSIVATSGTVVSAEGTTTLKYRSTDTAGNTEETRTATVRIDYTAPETTDDAPEPWIDGPTLVTLTSTDALSGVEGVRYSLDGLETLDYGAPIAVTGEGTHTIAYAATDAVGNTEETRTATVRIDDTAPETTDDAPSTWSTGTVTVHLTATDGVLSGVDKTYYCTDETTPSIVATSGTVISAEGTTTLKYFSVDEAGNAEGVKNIVVRIDRDAPETSDDAPEPWVGTPVTVHLLATDAVSGVNETLYSLDGTDPSIVATSGTVVSAEGTTTLKYRSTDTAGNTEETRTATVRIDYTDPETTDDAPEPWIDGPTLVSLTSSDALSGVEGVRYSLDGLETLDYGAPIAVTGEGTHTIAYAATDAVGNTEETRTATVRIDDTAPETTDDAPSTWSTGTVTVHLTATDGVLSGVDNDLLLHG